MKRLSVGELSAVFEDVTPIPQKEVPEGVPICRIDYSSDFVAAYDYFRALIHADEYRTIRALRLTELCLQYNPANYTVWHFRRRCLYYNHRGDHGNDNNANRGGGGDDDDDNQMSFLDKVRYDLVLAGRLGGENPKNYQIWYHRRALLEEMDRRRRKNNDDDDKDDDENEGEIITTEVFEAFLRDELAYLEGVARADGKNYHAWSHRQWIVQTLSKLEQEQEQGQEQEGRKDENNNGNIWASELEFVERLIEQDDIRNNSAWNHRWFLSHRGCNNRDAIQNKGTAAAFPAIKYDDEIRYALKIARVDPYNESPWRYFVAIMKEWCRDDTTTTTLARNDELLQQYEDKILEIQKDVLAGDGGGGGGGGGTTTTSDQNDARGDGSSNFCPHLVGTIVDLLELRLRVAQQERDQTTRTRLCDRMVDLIERLESHDPIRQKYWNFRKQQIEQQIYNQ